MEIKEGNAPPVNSNIFATVYGEPGLGKTSFAITAEEPLLIDYDQRGHRAYNAERCSRVDAKSFEDIAEAATKYRNKFKTLVIDTVGRALDVKTQEIIKISTSNPSLKAHNPFGGLSLPGYGILKSAFYAAANVIRDSNMDVVFVAHGRRTKEGDNTCWEPDIVGSSSDEIYKISDMLGLMCMVGGKRSIRLNPSDSWQAKNPLGLSLVRLDKDDGGWSVTMAELIEKCRTKTIASSTPVERPEILGRIEVIDSVEEANDVLRSISELPAGAVKDMAVSLFKGKRTALGFKYSKEKGVYA